jgi:Lar family restriction alleviation protein
MDKLKPCPFCGGEAEILYLDYSREHYVECRNKYCHLDVATDLSKTKKTAIKHWNKRAKNG